MLVHVFARESQSNSEWTNTYFSIQGENLNGTVPIRVCYFGKPVMVPKTKDGVDEKGNKIVVEVKDENGKAILEPKKDVEGKEVLRDDDFSARMDLLAMYSGNQEDGVVCTPVRLIAKAKQGNTAGNGKYNYFLVCGNEEIPIEVTDFSREGKPDYGYPKNCRKLYAMAEIV